MRNGVVFDDDFLQLALQIGFVSYDDPSADTGELQQYSTLQVKGGLLQPELQEMMLMVRS